MSQIPRPALLTHRTTPFRVVAVRRRVDSGDPGNGGDEWHGHSDSTETTILAREEGPGDERAGGDNRRGQTDEEGLELVEPERGDDEGWALAHDVGHYRVLHPLAPKRVALCASQPLCLHPSMNTNSLLKLDKPLGTIATNT